ncbi:hypothetical protein BC937DRAFT_94379 [Endogone sp. FLAS-F59071]|nr:hypothetical protein BC937DRAFT_94379 [Endogone sp. FLAS-F59071]|eukprot:RUS20785.1 hypothetical protein BC937DRAFT_94379 [Endogone sp. FLAS-F59071]
MGQSSDEEDYMSEKFLNAADAETSSSHTYSQRRKQELRKQQQRGYIKSRKELEMEARELGLQKQIGEDNKGMKILKKMGFNNGMTLGKTTKENGLKVPIVVELKSGRKGIGLETIEKRKANEELEMALAKRREVDQNFLGSMVDRFNEGRTRRRIKAAAHLCQSLDEKKSNVLWGLATDHYEEEIENNSEPAPQPILGLSKSLVVVDADESETEDQADTGTPKLPSSPSGSTISSNISPELKELHEIKIEDQLNRLVTYLRSEHLYCFWCGTQYADKDDLLNCPGFTEEDHD